MKASLNWARPVSGLANVFLTVIGAATELGAQTHYGGEIKPEYRKHVFSLSGDGNGAGLFAEPVTAPAYILREIIKNPGDAKKWGVLAEHCFL